MQRLVISEAGAAGAKIEHSPTGGSARQFFEGHHLAAGAGSVCETQRLLRNGAARARALDGSPRPARRRPRQPIRLRRVRPGGAPR